MFIAVHLFFLISFNLAWSSILRYLLTQLFVVVYIQAIDVELGLTFDFAIFTFEAIDNLILQLHF